MKKTLLHLLLLFLSLPAIGQQKYWVFFDQKPTNSVPAISQTTLANRAAAGLPLWQYTDLPVDTAYLHIIEDKLQDQRPVIISRWLNALTVSLTEQELTIIRELSFVKKVRPVRRSFYIAGEAEDGNSGAAYALNQIGASELKAAELNGEGVIVGVIDAGFYKADRKKELVHLFENNRILGARDYLDPARETMYRPLMSAFDAHGTHVLENIAGSKKNGSRIGAAPGVSFYLARTDHGSVETKLEEDYWIAALEWMDSLGVRLVNSSLGYADGFDNPAEDHLPEELDGETLPVTLAAQVAADEKGMLIIASAGNEGDRDWKVLSAPADAPSVMAVGACGLAGDRMPFSSIGMEENGIKPEVCCFSNSGTSFSAPVITGLAACLMQYNDTLTGPEVKAIIEKSGTLYPYGNNYIGYGVPSVARAIQLAGGAEIDHAAEMIEIDSDQYAISPDWMGDEAVVIFEKSDAIHVTSQNVRRTAGEPLTLFRKQGIAYTTVLAGDKVIEIKW